MSQAGDGPKYVEFPDPTVENEDQVLINVKAAAIKHIDQSIARGQHYSAKADPTQARIIGGDGVGTLADGTRVYGVGSGMVAQRALINKNLLVALPDNLDDATAAALANAVIGAAMGLRFKADVHPGDTVLINGATGVTGRVAVQIARLYGAKTVIATGRNPEALRTLLTLGANEVISVQQTDDAFVAQIQALHKQTPIDVIIDYLWGHSAELLLTALQGNGSFTHKTRFVSVGSVTGDSLQLSAATLRSVDLQLTGSGLGSWTKQEVGKLFGEILPTMFQLAADGQLKIETVTVPLASIEHIYDKPVADGQRLVVII